MVPQHSSEEQPQHTGSWGWVLVSTGGRRQRANRRVFVLKLVFNMNLENTLATTSKFAAMDTDTMWAKVSSVVPEKCCDMFTSGTPTEIYPARWGVYNLEVFGSTLWVGRRFSQGWKNRQDVVVWCGPAAAVHRHRSCAVVMCSRLCPPSFSRVH